MNRMCMHTYIVDTSYRLGIFTLPHMMAFSSCPDVSERGKPQGGREGGRIRLCRVRDQPSRLVIPGPGYLGRFRISQSSRGRSHDQCSSGGETGT